MRKYTFYFVCLLMLSVTVSCKKENKDNVLQARMTDFHTSKAYIDEQNYSCFRSGEEINVNNQNCSVTPNQQDNSRSCNISNVTQTSGYYAFYPSSLLESNADISDGFDNTDNVVLPQTQDFVYDNTLERQVINNPMAGHLEASSGTILLQNLCALLKVTVYSTSNSTLRSIDVTLKGTTIWGTGHVNDNDWSLVMEQQENHSTVTLSFGTNGRQGNPSGESFYIVVPKATIGTDNTNSVQVIIHGDYIANNLSVTTRTFQMGLSSNNDENIIPKNTITPLPKFSIGCHPAHYNNHPNCVFTVEEAANGRPARKVTIAQRILYEHINDHVWSCTGTPYHAIHTDTYNSYFTYNSNLTGSDDWGWQYTINGYPPRTWRTPTMDEWRCILNGSRGNSGNNKRNYDYKAVNGSWGLILYPDNFSGTYPSGNVNENQWTALENNGCIFLAGRNCGKTPNDNGAALGHGYYAAANSKNGSTCYCLYFKPKDGTYDQFDKIIYNKDVANTGGVNVRLVHDLN